MEGRGTVLAFVALIVAIFGGGVLLLATRPIPVQITILPPLPTATATSPAPLVIYVTGAVVSPGVVNIPAGSRVQDALDAAGGTLANVDFARVNLAARLQDGEQIYVPLVGETAVPPTPNEPKKVFINEATQAELEELPGVGPVLAAAIIVYRETNGRIDTLEEFDAIDGIGPAMLEDLAPLISFE